MELIMESNNRMWLSIFFQLFINTQIGLHTVYWIWYLLDPVGHDNNRNGVYLKQVADSCQKNIDRRIIILILFICEASCTHSFGSSSLIDTQCGINMSEQSRVVS